MSRSAFGAHDFPNQPNLSRKIESWSINCASWVGRNDCTRTANIQRRSFGTSTTRKGTTDCGPNTTQRVCRQFSTRLGLRRRTERNPGVLAKVDVQLHLVDLAHSTLLQRAVYPDAQRLFVELVVIVFFLDSSLALLMLQSCVNVDLAHVCPQVWKGAKWIRKNTEYYRA